jgi:sterol desaturase/sphingolipid hydroxylase (fatty acid hydroxylase superfamily)
VLALYGPVIAILGIDAFLLVYLAWAYSAPRFASRRISAMPPLVVGRQQRSAYFAMSSVLSLLFIFLMTQGLLFAGAMTTNAQPWWRAPLDAVVVIVVYDFLYYFLHRLMHHRRLIKLVHAIHHRARNPSALESFYLHPVELFSGLALLHACIGLYALTMGPMGAAAYAILFFFHSTLNILVHSGIVFGSWMTAPIDFLAKKHSIHHKDDGAKNFSSLTPIPDYLFGTLG